MENSVDGWYLPHRVKFFIILILQTPAIILCLLIFTFFILHHDTVLHKLQRKALLILFIVNFIQLTLDLPMTINFFHRSRVNPPTKTYCKWWIFLESTLDATNELLVTIIAIQRHIHIFQANILNVRRTRYLIYYLPLLFSIIYPIFFYMGAIVFYPCDDTQWNFTSNMCGDTTCFLSNKVLSTFDWIVNTGLPMVVLILANITLVIRIIRQKQRRQQIVRWSKQRRMTLQLISISSLYLIIWLPSIIVGLIQQRKPTEYLHKIQDDYISDSTYLICLCLPWISIRLVPEFKQWMLEQFHRLKRQTNMVRPTQ